MKNSRSNIRPAASPRWPAAILVLLSLAYVSAILILDQRQGTAGVLSRVAPALLPAALLTLVHLLIRYVRWRWLLHQKGQRFPFFEGLLAYFAGFAFTVSPGKVGELVRIRYFARMGVPPTQTIACFVFERLADLVVVLLLASLIMGRASGFAVAVGFVLAIFAIVVILASWRAPYTVVQRILRHHRWHRSGRFIRVFRHGLKGAMSYVNPRSLCIAFGFGFIAWATISLIIVGFVEALALNLPKFHVFAIQPAATLIGAASMLPGGVGSTEAAIVLLLRQSGVIVELGAIIAVATRVASLWLAMVLGILAMVLLELRGTRTDLIS